MLFHYTAAKKMLWGNLSSAEFPFISQFSRYGYLGVELFFVISGFVILMTAYERPIESFVASRISRLFPAYWVVVIATFVLHLFWDGDRSSTPLGALVNLTMLQEAVDVPPVQGAFWTLWFELKFYLLIGLFICVGMTRRRVIAFAFLWPLIAQLAAATDTRILESLLMASYAPYFAGGMFIYLHYRHGSSLLIWLGIGMNIILCARQAVAYAENRAPAISGLQLNRYVVLAVILLIFAAIILATCTRWATRIQWRWLTWLGALTYPVYLVHGQLGFFVIDVLHDGLNSYLVLALAGVGSFTVAWVINVLVEKRLQKPMRRSILATLRSDAR